jgi:hypothetical protein
VPRDALAGVPLAGVLLASGGPAFGRGTVGIPQTPQISVPQSGPSASAVVSGTITLTVTIANTGAGASNAGSLAATYPSAVAQLVGATVAGGSCSPDVTCTVPQIAADTPGAFVDFNLQSGFRLVGITAPQGTCTQQPRRCTVAAMAASAAASVGVTVVPLRTRALTVTAHLAPGIAVQQALANNVATAVVAAKTPPAKKKPTKR